MFSFPPQVQTKVFESLSCQHRASIGLCRPCNNTSTPWLKEVRYFKRHPSWVPSKYKINYQARYRFLPAVENTLILERLVIFWLARYPSFTSQQMWYTRSYSENTNGRISAMNCQGNADEDTIFLSSSRQHEGPKFIRQRWHIFSGQWI